jgi:hypothetical protein
MKGHCGPFLWRIIRESNDAFSNLLRYNPDMSDKTEKTLSKVQAKELLETLEARFAANMSRHAQMQWAVVRARLDGNAAALLSLFEMEKSGGEPDVVGRDGQACLFFDCSPESPAARRSLCYDGPALQSRKANKPAGSAAEMAAAMGIQLLTEAQYRHLQSLGEFDLKTSSWIQTPDPVRKLGGALFCDRRFGRVFVYHNGAESYYAARGFRGVLSV